MLKIVGLLVFEKLLLMLAFDAPPLALIKDVFCECTAVELRPSTWEGISFTGLLTSSGPAGLVGGPSSAYLISLSSSFIRVLLDCSIKSW